MKENGFVKRCINFFLSRGFLLFLLIGALNTFNGTLFSYLFSIVLQDNLAFAIGYITNISFAYLFNSKFNFKRKLSCYRYMRFLISYVPNFIIQNITTFIFLNILDFHNAVAYFLSAVIGGPFTYLCLKIFAFSEPTEKEMQKESQKEKH